MTDALFDFEKELTCSICTEILYQPLTLLDCLHTYCGGCLKEWFRHQRASAVASRRARAEPYTCPSCREPVRGTKADWRITAPLEGFLKAHPEKDRSSEDKGEMSKIYKPGDNVLPPMPIASESESDSDDERLLAEISALSLENLDAETMRARMTSARENHRRQTHARRNHPRSEELARQHQSSRWAASLAEAQQEADDRQIEHQPSLRSLLGNSDVQQEILQSIYSEGLLEGINLESLTTAQEEELTERIAEAYRRRQRNRDRSRNRERRNENERSGQQPASRADSPSRQQARTENASAQQANRSRPPISRPHLFEQGGSDSDRNVRQHRRTGSASSQRSQQQGESQNVARRPITSAARSATDLSRNPASDEDRRRHRRTSSGNARSSTNPEGMSTIARNARVVSASLRPDSSSPRARSHEPSSREATRSSTGTSSNTQSTVPAASIGDATSQQSVRPMVSQSAFAPEPVVVIEADTQIQPISCSRCNKQNIQTTVHYNCSKCSQGAFNLCLACYRAGKGCYHWFGFGYMANEKWQRMRPPEGYPKGYEPAHVLNARRYIPKETARTPLGSLTLQEGAFCEICHDYADDSYWYCDICFAGAWGFCRSCTLRGKHCTHPILSVKRVTSAVHQSGRLAILPLPHVPPEQYIHDSMQIDCDICRFPIPAASPRFHCNECSEGDYDICAPCYSALCAAGTIRNVDGEHGWRRCPQRHRMSVIVHDAAKRRVVIRQKIGGVRLKEEVGGGISSNTPPLPALLQMPTGTHYGALWSYFPADSNSDELSFPRGAEISECETMNEDWSVGVYAGRVGVFPTNHTRKF